MKLTPLDIRHKEFKRGMRGYVDGEVDEFLDEIADEFERLFKENIELSERGEALQEKIDQYRNLEETLQNTLVAAQRSAEELRANAQKEAQLIMSEAELKARQMVNESYADKQKVEKQIVVLRSSEEDFRFKFRSLLEGYTKQLAEVEAEAKKTGRFATPTEEIKDLFPVNLQFIIDMSLLGILEDLWLRETLRWTDRTDFTVAIHIHKPKGTETVKPDIGHPLDHCLF